MVGVVGGVVGGVVDGSGGGLRVVVVGGGIFGATAALTLSQRGHAVTLVDPGPLPHPLAASTDLSKVVRIEYGPDEGYMALGERALEGWRRWNVESGDPLFHETGVLFVRRAPMEPGTFEYESLVRLQRRGHRVDRLGGSLLAQRFPAWSTGRYADGFFHHAGGYAESGRVVSRVLAAAQAAGATLREDTAFTSLCTTGERVTGIALADGSVLAADQVVLAVGSWTPHMVPALSQVFRSVGQPVFHLAPTEPEYFMPERFPVFGADISGTGWYGFPVHPTEGVVKIANHGLGRAMNPEHDPREVTRAELDGLREFLSETFPSLLDARLVRSRVCLYCDTADGHFWIDRDPERHGLVVATGGSGHAFKFAPVLGDLIANVVEDRPDPTLDRFRWRSSATAEGVVHQEAARHRG